MHANDKTEIPDASQRDMSKLSGSSGSSGKMYYTISEVSDMCGIKPHVLRYWESEFASLRPRKGPGGSRRYQRRDIEEVLAIKSLLHDQGYRIAGARKVLVQRHRKARTDGGERDTFDPSEAAAQPSTQLESPRSGADQLVIPFGRLDREAQLDHVRDELKEVLSLVRDLAPRTSRSAKA